MKKLLLLIVVVALASAPAAAATPCGASRPFAHYPVHLSGHRASAFANAWLVRPGAAEPYGVDITLSPRELATIERDRSQIVLEVWAGGTRGKGAPTLGGKL